MPRTLYGTADPRDLPNYSIVEGARWLGLANATLRTWLLGQKYPVRGSTRMAQPVISPAAKRPLELSFWNLVESSVLAAIRKTHGVSFQKVRRALLYVEREFGQARPLIQEQFATDGVHLFVERYGKLIAASEHGQMVLRDVIAASLTRIERDPSGLASRLYPWSHAPTEPRVVSVDPQVSFGRPTVVDSGVPVEVLLERFRAGDTIERLAHDYRVRPSRIEDVVRWAAGGSTAA